MKEHYLTGLVNKHIFKWQIWWSAATLLGIDSLPIEGFNREKVEAYLKEKGFLNTDEFGVSVMASFGYRDQEITPKVRWNKRSHFMR